LGSAEPNNFFVILTTSTAHYTNDPISLIELNPLILLDSSTTAFAPGRIPHPLAPEGRRAMWQNDTDSGRSRGEGTGEGIRMRLKEAKGRNRTTKSKLFFM
jgi:hypothetical protein